MKYAVKYKRIRYGEDVDILLPCGLVTGEVEPKGEYFNAPNEIYAYVTNPILDGKYIIGDAHTMEELRSIYGFEDTDTEDDIIEYFQLDQSDKISLVKDGQRMQINLFDLFDDENEKTIYQILDGESSVVLNKKIIDILNSVEDLDTLKEMLRGYSDRLASFEEKRVATGLEAIMIKNGSVVEMDFPDTISLPNMNSMANPNSQVAVDFNSEEFTVKGLYEHLKSCIIGHDEELKQIATILMMNYFSTPEYGTENILIPGPTGTGKTATFNAASKYFNVPFRNINAINLVPEGIVGTTIEDEFMSLIEACNGDVSKAEKSILVFDEFDKLGVDKLDIKSSLVNIFLKVLEGGSFPINRQLKATKVFNTRMSSKIALGTFVEAYKKEKNGIGFATEEKQAEEFDKNLLIKKGYFTPELLTRFQHFVPYKELTEEDKRRIILESKLSTYLLKKQRLLEQFGVDVIGDEVFADGVLEKLKADEKSVRDINNIITSVFLDIEFELLSNKGKYKTLELTRDTVSGHKFDLR